MALSLATLRISLDDLPTISRVVTVPMSITLVRLHDVIQCAMGWKDSHLHFFKFHGKDYVDHSIHDDAEAEDELTTTLDKTILAKGESFRYLYDMGDYWKHTITILDIQPLTDDLHPFVILGGSGNCPPEDVGGSSGFEEFCEVMKKPTSRAYKEYKTWYGGDYDREWFELAVAQARLDELIRSGRGYPWED